MFTEISPTAVSAGQFVCVAIDGNLGAGKGDSIANLKGKFSRRGRYAVSLSSGAFYRALAFLVLRAIGIDAVNETRFRELSFTGWTDHDFVAEAKLAELDISDGVPTIATSFGRRELTHEELYSAASHHFSSVFAKGAVRTYINGLITDYVTRLTADPKAVLISDGRDMSLILGNLITGLSLGNRLVKITLEVDDEEAARRRNMTVEEVRERNNRDAEQTVVDPDAFRLDTTRINQLEVAIQLDMHICERFPELRRGMFVISGPSGVGKHTVLTRLKRQVPYLVESRSMTTRTQRPGESPEAYIFVSHAEFQAAIKNGEMIEYAIFGGNYYGTPKTALEHDNCVLEIDVQGAKIITERYPDVLTIMIIPPGNTVEEKILVLAGRMDADEKKGIVRNNREARLKTARLELEFTAHVVVVNDFVDTTVDTIAALI